mgnify:CR=1 FL=1
MRVGAAAETDVALSLQLYGYAIMYAVSPLSGGCALWALPVTELFFTLYTLRRLGH